MGTSFTSDMAIDDISMPKTCCKGVMILAWHYIDTETETDTDADRERQWRDSGETEALMHCLVRYIITVRTQVMQTLPFRTLSPWVIQAPGFQTLGYSSSGLSEPRVFRAQGYPSPGLSEPQLIRAQGYPSPGLSEPRVSKPRLNRAQGYPSPGFPNPGLSEVLM